MTIRPDRAEPGDVVIISGDIGLHGVAVMSVREGLEFGSSIVSDTAPLHELVADMLDFESYTTLTSRVQRIKRDRAKKTT